MSTATTRQTHVDALRGFALLGIAIVNSAAMASAWYGSGLPDPAFASALDDAVRRGVAGLFETKFYLLFSFLFGYSFTLQMSAAERDAAALRPRFLRRLLGLALVGVAHAVFLFQGDILLTYAGLGLLLLALRGLAPRRAVALGLALLLATVLAWSALALLASLSPTRIDAAAVAAQAGQATQAYRAGATQVVQQHLRDLGQGGVAFVLLFVQAPCALASFLFGLAAGRSGALNALARSRRRLPRLLLGSAAIGLAGAWAYAHPGLHNGDEHRALWALAIDLATAPFLSVAWGCALLWVMQRPLGQRLQAALAPAGRLALTHYLGQSWVGALVFTGWGWAQIGRWSPAQTLLYAVVLWLLQLAVSHAWLQRHTYGPAEWLLRALTLWRWPAWRRQATAQQPL